jgi:hypothetical protein
MARGYQNMWLYGSVTRGHDSSYNLIVPLHGTNILTLEMKFRAGRPVDATRRTDHTRASPSHGFAA